MTKMSPCVFGADVVGDDAGDEGDGGIPPGVRAVTSSEMWKTTVRLHHRKAIRIRRLCRKTIRSIDPEN